MQYSRLECPKGESFLLRLRPISHRLENRTHLTWESIEPSTTCKMGCHLKCLHICGEAVIKVPKNLAAALDTFIRMISLAILWNKTIGRSVLRKKRITNPQKARKHGENLYKRQIW